MYTIATTPHPDKPLTAPVVYYAQYVGPDGVMLFGTAQDTPRGLLFIDEAGATPFYAATQAVTKCGQVALADAQHEVDQATRWMEHMQRLGYKAA